MSDEVAEPMGNRKQYAVRNTASHRVVHTTAAGLASDEALVDAKEQLVGFQDTHPEQAFEVVQL